MRTIQIKGDIVKTKKEGRRAINVSIAAPLHAKFTEECQNRGLGYSEVLVECVRAWLTLVNKTEGYVLPSLIFKTMDEVAYSSNNQARCFPSDRMRAVAEPHADYATIGKIKR